MQQTEHATDFQPPIYNIWKQQDKRDMARRNPLERPAHKNSLHNERRFMGPIVIPFLLGVIVFCGIPHLIYIKAFRNNRIDTDGRKMVWPMRLWIAASGVAGIFLFNDFLYTTK
jgi:hypothetical protein